MSTLYDSLGTERGAGKKEIDFCYRAAVQELQADDPRFTERLQQLNAIHFILAHSKTKAAYNKLLDQGKTPSIDEILAAAHGSEHKSIPPPQPPSTENIEDIRKRYREKLEPKFDRTSAHQGPQPQEANQTRSSAQPANRPKSDDSAKGKHHGQDIPRLRDVIASYAAYVKECISSFIDRHTNQIERLRTYSMREVPSILSKSEAAHSQQSDTGANERPPYVQNTLTLDKLVDLAMDSDHAVVTVQAVNCLHTYIRGNPDVMQRAHERKRVLLLSDYLATMASEHNAMGEHRLEGEYFTALASIASHMPEDKEVQSYATRYLGTVALGAKTFIEDGSYGNALSRELARFNEVTETMRLQSLPETRAQFNSVIKSFDEIIAVCVADEYHSRARALTQTRDAFRKQFESIGRPAAPQ